MKKTNELVINYHLLENCNFGCHYCYAKWNGANTKNDLWRDLIKVEAMLKAVFHYFKSKGWESLRLTLAGGEPFLVKSLGEIVKLAKNIGFKVSIITNGSLLSASFINYYGKDLSVLGISVDSTNALENKPIGRIDRAEKQLNLNELILNINSLRVVNPDIEIKINTVVNRYNINHDMSSFISQVKPNKWKIFRVLPTLHPESAITEIEFNH